MGIDSITSFVMESFANVDGRGFQEQRYTVRSWKRLLQGPVVEIDSQLYHEYIVSDKAMKVRMLHYELKWEIPRNQVEGYPGKIEVGIWIHSINSGNAGFLRAGTIATNRAGGQRRGAAESSCYWPWDWLSLS